MTSPEKVMEILKEQKARSGLTTQQLADATGIPASNIKRYFAGDIKNPSLFYTAAACQFFGISLDEMLGLDLEKSATDSTNLEKEIALCCARIEKERKLRRIWTVILAVGLIASVVLR